jgi:RNA-directed DNA polymerase
MFQSRRYIKQLRKWLYLWETYSYEKAYRFFLNDYSGDKRHLKSGLPNMDDVIKGKLNYLGMVKGLEDQTCTKLFGRYKILVAGKEQISLDSVLDVLLKDGLDKAMDLYSRKK